MYIDRINKNDTALRSPRVWTSQASKALDFTKCVFESLLYPQWPCHPEQVSQPRWASLSLLKIRWWCLHHVTWDYTEVSYIKSSRKFWHKVGPHELWCPSSVFPHHTHRVPLVILCLLPLVYLFLYPPPALILWVLSSFMTSIRTKTLIHLHVLSARDRSGAFKRFTEQTNGC